VLRVQGTVAIVLTLVASLLGATSAQATTVTMTSSDGYVEGDGSSDPGPGFGAEQTVRLNATTSAGERNTVTLVQEGRALRVTDTSAPLTAGNGCKAESATVAVCTIPAATEIDVVRISAWLELGDGDDTFTWGGGPEVIDKVPIDLEGEVDAGPGADTITTAGAALGVKGGAGDDHITGAGVEGGEGNDELTGTDGADRLTGGAGNDTLRSLAGDDTLLPGTGDDTVDGGSGLDAVSYSAAKTGVTVDLATQTMTSVAEHDALAGIENATGSEKTDRLNGDDGPNHLDGEQGGADVIDGRGGDDNLAGGNSKARLLGRAGDDTLDSITTTSDCGPGRDVFGGSVIRLGVVTAHCELADPSFFEQIPADPLIDVAKSGIKNGRFELTLISKIKTRRIDVQLFKAGKVLAERRRVQLRGSKTGTTNHYRVPLRRQGKNVLRKGKLVEVQLWLKADTNNIVDTQHVSLKR